MQIWLRRCAGALVVVLAVSARSDAVASHQTGAASCPFSKARNIAFDRHSNVLYLTSGTTISRVSTDGRVLATWASSRSSVVATDIDGNVYVAESSTIVKRSPDGHVLARWGGMGRGPGRFDRPGGIVVDPTGTIYVSDYGNARIQKLSAKGKLLAIWASRGRRLIFNPAALALDTSGNLYYLDRENDSVGKLSSHGILLASLGHFPNPGQSQFEGPTGLTIDPENNLYVSDYNFVQKLSPAGRILGTWGGLHPGKRPGHFWLPAGLAVDEQGNIYVVELGNQRVQKLSAAGVSEGIWGCPDA
jgi:DNA-binding beta-propeller fold protein YncE